MWLGCTGAAGGVMMFDPWARRTHRFAFAGTTPREGGVTVAVAYRQGGPPGVSGPGVTGLAVEPATGDVWASFWSEGHTGRLKLNEGDLGASTWTLIATAPGKDLRGVGFDYEGFAWTHGVSVDRIWKIDPKTNRHVSGYESGVSVGGGPHYTYSDFTGSTGLSFTAPRGLWRFDAAAPQGAKALKALRWAAYVPERATAEVRLRPAGGAWVPRPTKDGKASWFTYPAGALDATVDLAEHALPPGEVEVQVRLTATGQERPIVNHVELVWR